MAETEFDKWVMRLIRENMPIFTRTAQSVAGMAGSENCSLANLAWSILEDPSLTAHVLKLANSIYYNPGSKRISTVSRALLRLGADTVKEMCLGIALVETVLSGLHKEKVAIEISRAFHAAVQARRMAKRRSLSGPEEIFIGALLTRIGNMVFWCFSGQEGEKLERAMLNTEREDEAEMEVLGFKLERLTLRLSQEWRLSDLLESVFYDKKGTDPRVLSIRLGCAVARASENGWHSPEMEKIIGEAADFLQSTEEETVKMLHESAIAASEITASYGAKKSSGLIPLPEQVSPSASPAAEIKHKYPEPDPNIQLCSLRDLSTLVTSGKGDVNLVLSIVLEGIYRGIGMDRVVFALLMPDRRRLVGKYGLGCVDDGWVGNLIIDLDPKMPNIFDYLIKNNRPVRITDNPDKSIEPLLTEKLSNQTGGGPFLATPIAIKGTIIGVIYADRNLSGRSLDDESFESFAFFGQQASLNLSMLGGK